jgi:hypothetical protein
LPGACPAAKNASGDYISVDRDRASLRRRDGRQRSGGNQLSRYLHCNLCQRDKSHPYSDRQRKLYLRRLERGLFRHQHLQCNHDCKRERDSDIQSRLWSRRNNKWKWKRHGNQHARWNFLSDNLLCHVSAEHGYYSHSNASDRRLFRRLERRGLFRYRHM